jgi:hypothetical protein
MWPLLWGLSQGIQVLTVDRHGCGSGDRGAMVDRRVDGRPNDLILFICTWVRVNRATNKRDRSQIEGKVVTRTCQPLCNYSVLKGLIMSVV